MDYNSKKMKRVKISAVSRRKRSTWFYIRETFLITSYRSIAIIREELNIFYLSPPPCVYSFVLAMHFGDSRKSRVEKSRGSNQLANLWNFRVNAEDTGGSFTRYSRLGPGGSRFRNIEPFEGIGLEILYLRSIGTHASLWPTELLSSPGLRNSRVISKRVFFSLSLSLSPPSPCFSQRFETNPASMYFKHFYGIVRSIRRDERNTVENERMCETY